MRGGGGRLGAGCLCWVQHSGVRQKRIESKGRQAPADGACVDPRDRPIPLFRHASAAAALGRPGPRCDGRRLNDAGHPTPLGECRRSTLRRSPPNYRNEDKRWLWARIAVRGRPQELLRRELEAARGAARSGGVSRAGPTPATGFSVPCRRRHWSGIAWKSRRWSTRHAWLGIEPGTDDGKKRTRLPIASHSRGCCRQNHAPSAAAITQVDLHTRTSRP
jgi:hypothetical protein